MSIHPDLDLKGHIRPGLDILANEIVIALKKRTRFRCNEAVYQPGLVIGRPDVSLLSYELAQIERGHAELGRYAFASQDAYSDVAKVTSIVVRSTPDSPVREMASGVGDRIVEFYRHWVGRACKSGSEESTYGETVTADVVALLAIMERVNLGKLVAESKYLADPQAYITSNGDREVMLNLILHKDREGKVLDLASTLATHYDLEPEHAVDVFKFMIEVTKDIEVDYLRMRIAQST